MTNKLNIDLDRIIWDVDYRREVIAALNGPCRHRVTDRPANDPGRDEGCFDNPTDPGDTNTQRRYSDKPAFRAAI